MRFAGPFRAAACRGTMRDVFGQAPSSEGVTTGGFVDAMQHLGWVDVTALSVLLVFFVLGLFKGFLWQASRVAILVAAYAAATQLGEKFGQTLLDWTHSAAEAPTDEQRQTAFYIACVLLFLGVLIALSLLALLLQRLIKSAGLGFYDRLGGGLVGVATGGVLVLCLLMGVFMFWPQSNVAAAASSSHALRLSHRVVDLLGNTLPEDLRRVLPADQADGTAVPADSKPAEAQPKPVDASSPTKGR